eukprot:scaffold4423_cov159-Skeletonema_menzelii.AAC.3
MQSYSVSILLHRMAFASCCTIIRTSHDQQPTNRISRHSYWYCCQTTSCLHRFLIVASNAHHYVALVPVVNAMLYALSVRTQSYNLPTVSSEDGPLRRNQYPKGSNMSVARAFCLWLRLIM